MNKNYKKYQSLYLGTEQAKKYKKRQETDFWRRFVSWRQGMAVARELRRYKWKSSDRLIDIPCGTGILGKMLQPFPFQIVASDMSEDMMALAQTAYPIDRKLDFIKSDITNTPFLRQSFACVVTLGFLHFAPPEIKRAALSEIAALSSRVAIISCSIDTPLQQLKHTALSYLKQSRSTAACPVPFKEIIAECESQGFRVVRAFMIVPFLSATALLVLEK